MQVSATVSLMQGWIFWFFYGLTKKLCQSFFLFFFIIFVTSDPFFNFYIYLQALFTFITLFHAYLVHTSHLRTYRPNGAHKNKCLNFAVARFSRLLLKQTKNIKTILKKLGFSSPGLMLQQLSNSFVNPNSMYGCIRFSSRPIQA